MSDDAARNELVAKDLEACLNRHGHGFQYAALQRCVAVARAHRLPLRFRVAELPVLVGANEIHIDFVISYRQGADLHLIAECKRVDPARGRWTFVRTPYGRENRLDAQANIDQVFHDSTVATLRVQPLRISAVRPFQLGFELRTDQPGDGTGTPKAINEAATQVSRATSGFIDFLGKHLQLVPPNGHARIVPVIFTTARLYTSEVDLGQSELETGKVRSLDVKHEPWLWFQYNQSSSLRPKVPVQARSSPGIGEILEAFHSRAIAVVSVDGIEPFLTRIAYQLEEMEAA